jgi:hypothetical protein
MTPIDKIRKIWMVAIGVLAAAAALVFAQSKNGNYVPSQLGSLQQPTPARLTPDGNYEVSGYPVPTLDLAPGEGLQEVRIYCNTCHSPRYITMQPPLPAATWQAEVDKMKKAFGATIPEDASHKIVAYLQAHYAIGNRR